MTDKLKTMITEKNNKIQIKYDMFNDQAVLMIWMREAGKINKHVNIIIKPANVFLFTLRAIKKKRVII